MSTSTEMYDLPGEPQGSIRNDFLGAYLAANPSQAPDGTPQSTVILLTDEFGLPLKNCKLIADKIADKVGCDVWIPDYFEGQPIIPLDVTGAPDRAQDTMSAMTWAKFILQVEIPAIPAFFRSRPSVVDARLSSFLDLLRRKRSYGRIGVVGYSYGASTAIRLASTDLISTAVICHPGLFTLDDVRKVKVPCSWVCPEVDTFVPRQKRLECEASFASRKNSNLWVPYEFVDYPGTQHGFASRPNLKYLEIAKAHEEALSQTVKWLKKTL